MAGRPPKPTALKLLSGNPGKRAIPDEVEIPAAPAVKPTWVAAHPLASPLWDELAPARMEIGLLTSVTAESFGQLCQLLSEQRLGTGRLKPAEMTHMRYLMGTFGFDPSSLTKLGLRTAGNQKPTNPFGKLGS